MKVLLFVGAGASVEAGIPAMRRMVEEFHDHLANIGLREDTLERFNRMLSRADYDMEDLIERVESLERGLDSQRELGLVVDDHLLAASRMVRWEAEWFVQHACERFRAMEAKVLWGAALRNIGTHELCVATSNYDRLLEVSCGFFDVPFDDGFETFDGKEVARWRGVEGLAHGTVKLLKVHGSTDWYKGRDGSIYKLRHSMPLYGDLALSIGDDDGGLPKLTSALILPTREKLVNEPPYPDLITSFRNIARQVDVAIFVGTSLRDPDLRDVCRQCAQRVPTFLVRLHTGHEVMELPDLKILEGTASGFLTSTLPKFLAGADGIRYLEECTSGAERTVGANSVLPILVAALEEGKGTDEVCAAIDRLVDYGAALDSSDIGRLLASESLAVRKYGLALIPGAVDVNAAMSLAEEQSRAEGEGPFASELATLVELMGT